MQEKAVKIFNEHKSTFGKYLITGTATVIINNLSLAVIILLTDFSEFYSVLLAAIITIIFGFVVNSLITFKSKMKLVNFIKYLILAAVDIAIIKFTTVLFLSLGINVFIVTLLNTGVVVPINYLAFKYLVFK